MTGSSRAGACTEWHRPPTPQARPPYGLPRLGSPARRLAPRGLAASSGRSPPKVICSLGNAPSEVLTHMQGKSNVAFAHGELGRSGHAWQVDLLQRVGAAAPPE